MMADPEYVLAHTSNDTERVRLGHLASWADAVTIRRLENVKVGAGWRCLEVGAGVGSVARWLAEQVGDGGVVVATDINPRFLTEMPENTEVRLHDILSDDLEWGAYDLVHCRLVLQHLPDPRAALSRMVAALAPGGWLVVEEMDLGLFAHGGHPESGRATSVLLRAFSNLPPADPYLGRKLPALAVEFGLQALGSDVVTVISRPGEPDYEMWRLTTQAVAPVCIARGADETEYRWASSVFDHADGVLVGSTLVAAWGRQAGVSQA